MFQGSMPVSRVCSTDAKARKFYYSLIGVYLYFKQMLFPRLFPEGDRVCQEGLAMQALGIQEALPSLVEGRRMRRPFTRFFVNHRPSNTYHLLAF